MQRDTWENLAELIWKIRTGSGTQVEKYVTKKYFIRGLH